MQYIPAVPSKAEPVLHLDISRLNKVNTIFLRSYVCHCRWSLTINTHVVVFENEERNT